MLILVVLLKSKLVKEKKNVTGKYYFLVYRKLYAIEILVLDKSRKTQFIE